MPQVDEQDMYLQSAELLRHYLSWREKLFGGYLVVIAALAVAVNKVDQPPFFRSAMALLGVALTVVFWLFERRIRELFLACLGAGAALEPPTLVGPFKRLQALDGTLRVPTHSAVLGCFFALAIVALTAIAMYYWP